MNTRLLGAVITASAIATALLFAMMLPAVLLLGSLSNSHVPQGVAGVLIYGVAVLLAALWLFRHQKLSAPAREARTAAISFAATSPISMGIAMLSAPFAGGLAQEWFGFNIGRVGILAAIMAGVLSVTAALSFLFVSFALWLKRSPAAPAPPSDNSSI